MNITIKTIQHKDQRYPTVGDWQYDDQGNLTITISELGDWRMEALIAVHELVETLLCKQAGIKQIEVDAFDVTFEHNRPPSNKYEAVEGENDEPGDEPTAPYVRQHCVAIGFERILAAELGVLWKLYEEKINAL